MKNSSQSNRRRFLKSSAAVALGAPAIIPSSALGQACKPAHSKRIAVGLIGCGARGAGVMKSFLNEPSMQVVAVCDPYKLHYRGRKEGCELGCQPAAEAVGKKCGTKPCDTCSDFVRGKTSMRSSWLLRTIGTQCRRLGRCETVRTFTAKNRSPTFLPKARHCIGRWPNGRRSSRPAHSSVQRATF